MEVNTYFSSYNDVIAHCLKNIKNKIIISAEWVLDPYFSDILQKHSSQIYVVLINNQYDKATLDTQFNSFKIKNFLILSEDYANQTLYKKFCIIDDNTILIHSNHFGENHQNITVIKDDYEFISDFFNTLNNICQNYNKTSNIELIQHKLKRISLLIAASEYEEIPSHCSSLLKLSNQYGLSEILDNLKQKKYQQALDLIQIYLTTSTNLILAQDSEAAKFQFELKILELKLKLLNIEKSKFEEKIIQFSSQYYESLNTSIQELEKLQAKYIESIQQAKSQQKTQPESDEIPSVNEYSDIKLNTQDEEKLKKLYRRACSLCHPDRVPDDQKDNAHQMFILLQSAYKNKDLKKLTQIYEQLKNHSFKASNILAFTKIDTLKSAIEKIQSNISIIFNELLSIKNSHAGEMLLCAGDSTEEWQKYFEQQKVFFENEIKEMHLTIILNQFDVPEKNEE